MLTPVHIAMRNIQPFVNTPVVFKVPADRPERFIRVDMAAPIPTSPISYQGLVIIQAYAPNPDDCLSLLDQAKRAMELADINDGDVSGWEEEQGVVEFPDPDLPTVARWQLTGTLFYTT